MPAAPAILPQGRRCAAPGRGSGAEPVATADDTLGTWSNRRGNEVFGRFFDVDPLEMLEPTAYARPGALRAGCKA